MPRRTVAAILAGFAAGWPGLLDLRSYPYLALNSSARPSWPWTRTPPAELPERRPLERTFVRGPVVHGLPVGDDHPLERQVE